MRQVGTTLSFPIRFMSSPRLKAKVISAQWKWALVESATAAIKEPYTSPVTSVKPVSFDAYGTVFTSCR